jgi:hypothetical protein
MLSVPVLEGILITSMPDSDLSPAIVLAATLIWYQRMAASWAQKGKS